MHIREGIMEKINYRDRTKLSEREKEVLLTCVRSRSKNSEQDAAAKLYCSHSTINTHMRSVRRKLNCHTQAQALVRALQTGQIELREVLDGYRKNPKTGD
jgi:DNA-binding CsgD family transcriptional regulator